MTTEVIVIVEDQNASAGIVFAGEVRGGEPTDSRTNNENVNFAFNG
jgi:hypothetical protein